jgi:hypothetical protein
MKDQSITELIGLGSVTAFVLTVLYMYGYQNGSGINLFLYFSVNDYFRQAIVWLTPTIIFGGIGMLTHPFLRRVERGATEEEFIGNSKTVRWFRRSGDWMFRYGLVIVAALATLLSLIHPYPRVTLYFLWGAAGCVLWFEVTAWYFKEPRVREGWTKSGAMTFGFLPALAIIAFFWGLADAERTFGGSANVIDTRIILEGHQDLVVENVLFALEDFIILRDDAVQQVKFIPRKEIKMLIFDE